MNLWSASSQFVNVLLMLGNSNESISGRAHREVWKVKKIINAIFFWQIDHCKSAYTNDLKWAQAYIDKHRSNHA